MATQTIAVGMDASQLKAGAEEINKALAGNASTVENLFQKMVLVNEQGQLLRTVFTGITVDGNKFTATLDATKKGFELVALQIDRTVQSLEKLRQAKANASKVETIAGEAIGGRQFDTAQAGAMQTAVERIKKVVAEGNIETQRLGELIDRLTRNPKEIIPGLNEQEAKFVKAYRAMIAQIEKFDKAQTDSATKAEQSEQKKAQAALDAAAKTAQKTQLKQDSNVAETQLRSQFSAPSEISRLNAYEQAIQKIKVAIDSGKVSLQRFNELSSQIKANPKLSLEGLTADEQKVVKSLREIQGSMDSTATAAKKAESAFISLGGIFRLLQAQVLKRIFGTLEAEILGSIAGAQQLSIAIAEIQTITQTAGISTKEWQSNISALANQFGNTQADVAEGAYQAVSNQVTKAGDTFTFLAEAQKFAAATNSTTAQSVNLLSGAIKSFGLDVTDTERVASVFFKTIELGRVRAGEMSDTFGRIGTIASEVGVKLEEVAAGVATLTVRGTKFNDASTIMSNLLLKLIRPTDEMKKLFAEWGVATGQQAISTFGFVGVLQKLEVEAQKGSGRLGDLFNQIRALRGAFNFTGQGLADFQENLGKIGGGGEEYQAAIEKVLKSPGKQLQIELQKIRSYFIDDFGTSVLEGLIKFRDGLQAVGIKDFVDGIKKLIGVMQVLTTTWIGYRSALIAANAYQAVSVATMTATGLQAQALTTTMGLLGAAFLGAFGVGYALGEAWKWLQPMALGAKQLGDEFDRINKIDIQKKFDAAAAPQRAGDNKQVNDVNDAAQIRLQAVLKFSAAINAKFSDLKARAIQNQRDITEALKLSSKTYFDSIGDNIKKLNEKITESKNIINQSKKVSEDLPRGAENRVFDTKLKYASEGQIDNGQLVNEQKSILLKQKLEQTLNRAREEAAKGTKESIEESRKLFGDAEQLQTQLFDQQTSNERRLFEDRVKRGEQAPTRTDSQGRDQFEFVVRTADYTRKVNALSQERLAIEEQIRASKEKQRQADEAAVELEKTKLRDLQEQFTKLEKLSLFNKEGNLKNEFKGPGGAAKATAEFDAVAIKIQQLAGGDTAQSQFTVFAELQRQKQALIQTVNIAQRQEEGQTAAQSIIISKQAADKIATDTKAAMESKTATIGEKLAALDRQLEVIETRDLPKRLDSAGGGDRAAAEDERLKAITLVEAVKKARDEFEKDTQSPEKANLLKQKIDELTEATRKYILLRTGRNANEVKIGTDQETVGDRTDKLTRTGERVSELAGENNQLRGKLSGADKEAQNFKDKLSAIPGLLDNIADGLVEASPVLQDNFKQVGDRAAEVVEQVIELNEQIGRLNRNLPELRGEEPPQAPGSVFGGEVKYMNSGGMVGFVPRGSDRHPAMLAGGERVMTERSNREFAPILQAMNNGALSKYNPSGGSVTNVGDININYNGGNSTGQNLRELGVAMRRGIRRGTLNLNN